MTSRCHRRWLGWWWHSAPAVMLTLLLLSLISTVRDCKCDTNDIDAIGEKQICVSDGCVRSAASVLANMDKSVNPCDNFYEFACGKFIRDAKVDDDKTSRTTFSAVNDILMNKVHQMLVDARAYGQRNAKKPPPRHSTLAKQLYGMCMNQRKLDETGTRSLLDLITMVGGWPVLSGDRWDSAKFSWTDCVYRFRELGLNIDYLVDLSVKVNHKNTSEHIVEVGGAALALNPLYMKRGMADKMVNNYYSYMVDVAIMLGVPRDRAESELRQSLEFEVFLARISQVTIEDMSSSFSVMTLSEMAVRYPSIPWCEYINRLACPDDRICVPDNNRIMVNMPSYLTGLEGALQSTAKRVQANYMVWRAVAFCVPFSDRRLRDRKRVLHEELFGGPDREPRWAECVDIVSSGLYLAIGGMYVKRYFDELAKNSVVDMVENIRKEMHVTLSNSDWMDSETKKNALDKAEAIDEFVAYPNELLDASMVDNYYVRLELDSGGDYFKSVLRLTKFLCDKNFEKLHMAVNKSDWVMHSRVAVVNAYYNLVENSIQIPAGLLQGMFFSGDRPNYMNYGGIGYAIGHEITHGFDDRGRLYDKTGNLRTWWHRETSGKYTDKAHCMLRQYSNFTADRTAGLRVNGLHTLGENIADNGGVMLAYNAYRRWSAVRGGPEPRLPGLYEYTARQMFWISAANIWCSAYRPETLRHCVLTDYHSPGRYRVIGSFQNQQHFATDFRCPVGSYMNPVDKCKVW